ncbi:MAG: hypothetical protein WBZ40_12405 [Acidimicrobiia bacterium]
MGFERGTMRLAVSVGLMTIALTAAAEPAGEGMALPIDLAPQSNTMQEVTVVAGDHLWKMSKAHLESQSHHDVSDQQVALYWRLVIEKNRGRIRSGDPDLIYPGEIMVMPATG